MRRILPLALMFLLLAATVQAAEVKKQLPGDPPLAETRKVLKTAVIKVEAQGVPMNIAVVDAGGNLKAFMRQDDAFLGSIDVATQKARTARFFNMSTAQLDAASQPGKELYDIEVTNDGLAIFGGGELLVKDGLIVGAIGVSGGSVTEDTNVTKTGAAFESVKKNE
ncbi:MAG: heme-binding protein [Desulfovibrio sp.]|uniref:GlcG/HbpS family heme-binding protein n=1 Tax=Desulfovibrio sp. TaxID=885 RepID=UPI00258FFE1E|nr:heme-binding protein [Desulfovibrio sp.]MCD7984211.1 heme-binding protein [Desulfovibrio sp.]